MSVALRRSRKLWNADMPEISREELSGFANDAAQRAADKVAQNVPTMEAIRKEIQETVKEEVQGAVSQAAELAANAAVTRTLISFGLNPADQMNIVRKMIFLDDLYNLVTSSKKHIILALLGAMSLGVGASVVMALRGGGKIP